MSTPLLPFPDTKEDTMPATVPTNVQIGRSVRALRNAAGLTQEQLADRMAERGVDLHHSSVSTTELGKRPLTLPEALAIADALGVQLDSLVDYERIEAERELAEAYARMTAAQARLDALAGAA